MKSLILLTATLLCSYALASGGGPSASDALKAEKSTETNAVIRFKNSTELIPEMLNLTIWLKANDADRSIQEFHGVLNFTVDLPTKDTAINFGFQFGMERKQPNSKLLGAPV